MIQQYHGSLVRRYDTDIAVPLMMGVQSAPTGGIRVS